MKDVTNPDYWRDRMYGAFASGERHRLMFNGSKDAFDAREATQREAIKVIGARQSVIDVGCGYGRLLELLRLQGWQGRYVGYDVSPDLVEIARRWWPDHQFYVRDIVKNPPPCSIRSHWAVAMWVRTMLIDNQMPETWEWIERWMRTVADNLLVVD